MELIGFPKRSLSLLGERTISKNGVAVSYLLLNEGVLRLEEGMNYGCTCPWGGASLLLCAHVSRLPGGSSDVN